MLVENNFDLHDAIRIVLEQAETPLTTTQIALKIEEKELWRRPKDGQFPKASQISARLTHHRDTFTHKGGVVSLSTNNHIDSSRIARICWNDKGWQLPSGRAGKSTYKGSHEAVYAYGHEEWLFDTSKLINGYHYAFLEPVRKQQKAYEGKAYKVWLYSIDGNTNARYFNGIINNLVVIGDNEANKIISRYKENGWFDEMKQQMALVGIEDFSGFKGVNMFNVKFKPEDVDYRDYIELQPEHPANKINRYSFTMFDEAYIVDNVDDREFKFQEPSRKAKAAITTATISRFWKEPGALQVELHHQLISSKLLQCLRDAYGYDNVRDEHPVNGNGRIDIVVRKNPGYSFYEIKTYPDVRVSIREALGQILEYCYFTESCRADELIIVTPKPADVAKVSKYVKHLRNQTKLNLYYQYLDLRTNELSKKL